MNYTFEMGRFCKRYPTENGTIVVLLSTVFLATSCGTAKDQRFDSGQTPSQVAAPVELDPHLQQSIPLEDLNPSDTIASLLKRRKANLDLSGLEQYAKKCTRKDMQLLQGEDGKFITKLNLGGCHLDDKEIEPISSLKLNTLSLRGCAVKNLHAIANMNTLVHLDVSDCPLLIEGVKVISKLNSLETIDMTRTRIGNNELQLLQNSKQLKRLDLSGCEDVTSVEIEKLKLKLPLCDIAHRRDASNEKKDGIEVLHRVELSLMNQHEFDEADLSLKRLIAGWERQSPPPYEYIARAYKLRGDCLYNLGRLPEAMELQQKSIDLYENYRHDYEMSGRLRLIRARWLEAYEKFAEAVKSRIALSKLWQQHALFGSARGESVDNVAVLAHDLVRLKRVKEAQAWLMRGVTLSSSMKTPSPDAEGRCLYQLAMLEFDDGKKDNAYEHISKAITMIDPADAPNRYSRANILLAQCLIARKDYKAAATAVAKARIAGLDADSQKAVTEISAILKQVK